MKHVATNSSCAWLEAAAFGRLCVETFIESQIDAGEYAAAFGRLCVETKIKLFLFGGENCSRLRAAVC